MPDRAASRLAKPAAALAPALAAAVSSAALASSLPLALSRALADARLPATTPLLPVGVGKAAGAMLEALAPALSGGRARRGGVLITKYGHSSAGALAAAAALGASLVEAGHPEPDAAGAAGAAALAAAVAAHGAGAALLVLLSGGGSALAPAPAPGLDLAALAAANAALLACGAPIEDVNSVRKHLSALTGGRLSAIAERAGCTGVVTLAVSDVIGDRADVIASGPTVADPSTFADALAVVRRYGLDGPPGSGEHRGLPPAALAHLTEGAAGRRPETPKGPPGPPSVFRVVAGNAGALAAAARALEGSGYTPVVLTASLSGEARHAAASFAALAASAAGAPSRFSLAPAARRVALLAGGETTVTLGAQSNGRGGRNQEFALAAALALRALLPPGDGARVVVAAFGTDGTDGPTDAAGAVVTGETARTAAAVAGLDAAAFLDAHDSYGFFLALERALFEGEGGGGGGGGGGEHEASPPGGVGSVPWMARALPAAAAGGLIRTGATGTNVMDVVVALVDRGEGFRVGGEGGDE